MGQVFCILPHCNGCLFIDGDECSRIRGTVVATCPNAVDPALRAPCFSCCFEGNHPEFGEICGPYQSCCTFITPAGCADIGGTVRYDLGRIGCPSVNNFYEICNPGGACCWTAAGGSPPFNSRCSYTPTRDYCSQVLNGSFVAGKSCSEVNSCKFACCVGNICTEKTRDECRLQSGVVHDEAFHCTPNPCATSCCMCGWCCPTTSPTLTCRDQWLGVPIAKPEGQITACPNEKPECKNAIPACFVAVFATAMVQKETSEGFKWRGIPHTMRKVRMKDTGAGTNAAKCQYNKGRYIFADDNRLYSTSCNHWKFGEAATRIQRRFNGVMSERWVTVGKYRRACPVKPC